MDFRFSQNELPWSYEKQTDNLEEAMFEDELDPVA